MKRGAQIIAPSFKRLREREVWRTVLKAEIEARFREQLRKAGFWERFKIRIRIAREVRAELNKKFPPLALYSTAV